MNDYSSHAPVKRARDDGAALVLVIAWSVLLLGMALIVAQAVVREIAPSGRNEHSYAALAAAEAGLEDYRAHLQAVPGYYQTPDPNNPALSGWAPVPGGTTSSEFRIAVDRENAGTGGKVRVYSTGRSGGITRTVMAIFSKRSTLNYAYLSDIETPAPTLPGAYSTTDTVKGTNGVTWDPKTIDPTSTDAPSSQTLAKVLCSHRWWEPGNAAAAKLVSPSPGPAGTTGMQRNLNFCQWAGINSGEKLAGKVHTNDVWRLGSSIGTAFYAIDPTTFDVGVLAPQNISSSCPTAVEDKTVGAVVCPLNHRFINTGADGSTVLDSSKVNLAPSSWNWNPADSSTVRTVTYQGNTYLPAASNNTGLATTYPWYDVPLTLPDSSNSLLKEHASDPSPGTNGCVFTGPTRIRFDTTGTYPNETGYMVVTSPDTKVTAAACGGSGPWIVGSTQQSVTVNLTGMKDLVIYIQDVPRPGAQDDPKNSWDATNTWATDTEPSCQVKSTNSPKYPYVITGQEVNASGSNAFVDVSRTTHDPIHPASIKKGYPSEYADPASPWYGSSCSSGDVYISGKYKGQMTVNSQNNIIIVGKLIDSRLKSGTTTGQPLKDSQSNLGLVSSNFTYVYRPSDVNHTWAFDWPHDNVDNIQIDATILAMDQCFAAQDPTINGTSNGNLFIWGSLAQKYRCIVGNNGGYAKRYSYDGRLAYRTPPYMVDLSTAPWEKDTFAEVTPLTQRVNVATSYPAYDSVKDTDVASWSNPVVAFPLTGVTAQKSGNNISVTATSAGPIIVEYDITYGGSTKAGLVETRRLVLNAQ
jgi:hypothetical protein